MRAEQVWSALDRLPCLDFATAFGQETILVVAPHPDDESLGCGGMIAEACATGRPPLVVIVTNGVQSHPNSARYPAERLRSVRETEARAATSLLGLAPDRLVFLGYPDTRAPTSGPAFLEAASRLTHLIRHHECSTVAVTWEYDPHCDHAAAAAMTALACQQTGARRLEYPVWGWTLPAALPLPVHQVSGFRLSVQHQLARKRAAIGAHASQYAGLITDDPQAFQLAPEFISRFLTGNEYFIVPRAS